MDAIVTRGLVKQYGSFVAVAGLDLQVAAGECFGLLGPNGAGKTTTIEILEGLLAPTAGEVELLGLDWQKNANALRQRIGIALQETLLSEKLTVYETVRLFRSFYSRQRSLDELLSVLQLDEKRDSWVMKLSGGQKQRLALACALVGEPDIHFLDEPTTGLDPQSRRAIWDLIEALRSAGKTVLLTTHYMDEAERLCDRIAIVDRGKIIAAGTPKELILRLGGEHVVWLKSEPLPDVSARKDLEGVRSLRAEAAGLALTVDALHVSLPLILARLQALGCRLMDLSTHHATLEDVFVSLTGRKLREE